MGWEDREGGVRWEGSGQEGRRGLCLNARETPGREGKGSVQNARVSIRAKYICLLRLPDCSPPFQIMDSSDMFSVPQTINVVCKIKI